MPRTSRSAIAAVLAFGLGLGGAMLMAAPAHAADGDPSTPGWGWESMRDTALGVSDVEAYFTDFRGTGIDLNGWTSDAFDGFLGTMTFTYNGITVDPAFSTVLADYVDNGLSTVKAKATADFGNGRTVDITRTLEIQGSYIRWTIAMDGAVTPVIEGIDVLAIGNLGSDTDSVYTVVGATGLLTTDGLDAKPNDPVIGYDFSGLASPLVTTGGGIDGDNVQVAFDGRTTQSFTVALLEYDPCSFDAAVSTMTGLVPSLGSTFGGTLAPHHLENCLEIEPLNTTVGSPINSTLALTQTPDLAAWGYYWDDAADYLRVASIDLPASLTVALVFDPVTGLPSLKVSGTAPVGTYRVLFYQLENGEGGESLMRPIVSTLVIGEALAASGTDTTAAVVPGLIGVAVLTIAGIVLLVVRRRGSARN